MIGKDCENAMNIFIKTVQSIKTRNSHHKEVGRRTNNVKGKVSKFKILVIVI